MAIKFQYNKTSLQSLDKQLKMRVRALPTIKNKESALRSEVKKAKEVADEFDGKLDDTLNGISDMLQLYDEYTPDILTVKDVNMSVKKIAGVRTPVLDQVEYEIKDFSLFNAPGWFLDGIQHVKEVVNIALEREFYMRKMELLDRARKKTTQKVNLYEKVQIPGFQEAIRKIKRFLEDEENLSKSAQKIVKKQLTQNIAHELKTPVSSIQGYLETIVNNPTLPREKINAFLERSYAQSNRLAHLLRDISVLTRMEEAPNMIETEPVNLTTMMRNILNEVTLELEEKQITAHNMLPEGLTVQGNSSLLYSIFRNLTDNAIAYAGTHISITIRCFREDERFYYFSFSDTGVGVGPEHLSRLFERFYRVDKGRSRKLGGTGLGLAIVKNAVILHGGTIFAKNTPGGGLEFIFTLSKE